MPIVADLVDAVIGADTHRDTHTLEMCSPSGVTLATITVPNTDAGFTDIRIDIIEASREAIRQWLPDSGLENHVTSANIQAIRP